MDYKWTITVIFCHPCVMNLLVPVSPPEEEGWLSPRKTTLNY